jgi:hypothetical protein
MTKLWHASLFVGILGAPATLCTIVVVASSACGSAGHGAAAGGGGSDAASDGSQVDSGDAGCPPPVDASFTCDVSKVPPGERQCTDWKGGMSPCALAFGWDGIAGGSQCEYQWTKAGPPDLCALPSRNGMAPFDWLHPACDAGCP